MRTSYLKFATSISAGKRWARVVVCADAKYMVLRRDYRENKAIVQCKVDANEGI